MKTLQQYGLERGLFGPRTIREWFTTHVVTCVSFYAHPTSDVWIYSPLHDMTCLREYI